MRLDELKFCPEAGQGEALPQENQRAAVMIYINDWPLSELAAACEEIYHRLGAGCERPSPYAWPEPAKLYATLTEGTAGETKAVSLLEAADRDEAHRLKMYFRREKGAVVWFGFHNPSLPGCKYPLLEPLYFDAGLYAERIGELKDFGFRAGMR